MVVRNGSVAWCWWIVQATPSKNQPIGLSNGSSTMNQREDTNSKSWSPVVSVVRWCLFPQQLEHLLLGLEILEYLPKWLVSSFVIGVFIYSSQFSYTIIAGDDLIRLKKGLPLQIGIIHLLSGTSKYVPFTSSLDFHTWQPKLYWDTAQMTGD